MNYACLLRFVTAIVLTFPLAAAGARAAAPKPADQAFQLQVLLDDEDNLELSWSIAPGHYLYRSRISAKLDGKPLALVMPHGELKDDPTFGPTEIYHRAATAIVAGEPWPHSGRMLVTYQGCAEGAVCYPPITRAVDMATLRLSDPADAGGEGSARRPDAPLGDPVTAPASEAAPGPTLDGAFLPTLLAFLGLGLLLSFTPCVLPMVPILSGILTRSGGAELSAARGFAISLAYVLAMAVAYASLGLFAAWTGANLQAALQAPVAVGAMSAIFVALALSMFGVFDLQLPLSWTAGLHEAARGTSPVVMAAVLGFGSALIVGPCVTPPLAAALIYVLRTGDVLRGSSALFALGLGMGLPLLAFGTLGARALPRSGPWLAAVKSVFGFMFLGLAMWMASRLLHPHAVAIGWGFLFIGFGAWVGLRGLADTTPAAGVRRVAKAGTSAVVVAFGFFLLLGGALRLQEPLQTLAAIGLVAHLDAPDLEDDGFEVVDSEAALVAAINEASLDRRTVLVDFSAEWCSECRIMERTVFADPQVRRNMRGLRLIRADLTDFDASRRKLMQRFSVVGPPTLIFLDPAGKEIDGTRTLGSVGVNDFLGRIARARRG